MPSAVVAAAEPDFVLPVNAIGPLIDRLCSECRRRCGRLIQLKAGMRPALWMVSPTPFQVRRGPWKSQRFQSSEIAAPFRFDRFPLTSLQREIDRLFDDFSRDFGRFTGFKSGELVPSMNVSETDGEIEFTAELPGMEANDVEVTLADNVLTIRGRSL